MSIETTAFDYVVTQTALALPNHLRLPNPYALDQNPIGFLNKGWGITRLSGVNSEREMACRFSVARTVRITITRKADALMNDAASRSSVESDLYDDFHALVNYFSDDISLGANIIQFKYVSDSGTVPVFNETDGFFSIAVDFTMEYISTIT